ncbi:hypothetical protein HMPREF0733_11229 [Rothia dentocariosa ATCC 17931]|jgi:hypothetical protein|uniref:Uncharacterized protein n=1 Tax=Rothia dentocariosa (strain ATCC 17931 / CDC X599 / XDIA) TaxID=762948 RepID=E3H4Q3_ROTDC|nr:hypothetical protein HMPREF0733_11229 [Rothia dentocariosa ATCC 17931]
MWWECVKYRKLCFASRKLFIREFHVFFVVIRKFIKRFAQCQSKQAE